MPDDATRTTEEFIPKDNAERNRILDALDDTLFVEASAGTGKTTSLVGRIKNLVVSRGVALNRIAAITFTEAAAAELRDRIREDLEKVGNSAAGEVEQAAIQTLHGFAVSLLRERPLEAGLPPSFDIMDDIQTDLAFEEAWAEWLDAALQDERLEAAFMMAFSMGMTIAHLHKVAEAFHANYELLYGAAFRKLESDAAEGSVVQTLLDKVDEMDKLCRCSKLEYEDELYVHTRMKIAAICRLKDLKDDERSAYRMIWRSMPFKQTRGRQADWKTDDKTGVNACKALKDLLTELEKAVDGALDAVRSEALVELLTALRDFVLDYASRRKEQGRAGFQDMLVWTKEMLCNDENALAHFRSRFSHLLIDEAQDTDPLQAEIAMLLAEDVSQRSQASAGDGDEGAVGEAGEPDKGVVSREDAGARLMGFFEGMTPEKGKLFVVGDPKQSIYRFRRADVRQMEALKEGMGGDTLNLSQNFRSQRPIAEWVNTLFRRWMEQGSKDQADYEPIVHRWEAEVDDASVIKPRVWRLGDVVTDDDVGGKINMETVREFEAKNIAVLLRQIVGEEWQILDSKETDETGRECYKSAEYSDVCILMPTRTGLRILEQELDEANIPYRLEGASLFFDTQEVRDLLNCLKAIDDPSDEVAIVAALRSPAFACTDVEILKFYQSGGRFNYLRRPRTDDVVADALAVLRDAHGRRMWTATAPLIDGFIRDRLLMETAIDHPRRREQWRRYRFVVEQARAFAAADGESLRAFLKWMQRQTQEGARITETPVPELDEPAVRIMTVHAAKGLEFPVVILKGLNITHRRRVPPVIFDRITRSVEVGVGRKPDGKPVPFRTEGFEEQAELDKAMEDDERVRLLYVATTRARDHLVLSMYRTENGKTDAHTIADILEDDDYLWNEVGLMPKYRREAVEHTPNGRALDKSEHSLEARRHWQDKRASLLAYQGRPASVSATQLAEIAKEAADSNDDGQAWESFRRGRGSASLGRAVHAVLQTVDLVSGAGIESMARAQAAAEGIPQSHAEVARLVRTAIRSDIVKRAVASGRYWREMPAAAAIGDGVLEGLIDLLFEEDGEQLVVVDYKTDSIGNSDLQEYIERYNMQAGSYALAVERATGMPVKDVVFLFLRPKREVSMQPIDALKADAERAAVGRLAGA